MSSEAEKQMAVGQGNEEAPQADQHLELGGCARQRGQGLTLTHAYMRAYMCALR